MPLTQYMTPGVYVEEVPGGPRPIQAVGTSTAGFVGVAPRADWRVNEHVAINNWSQFVREFVPEQDPRSTPLSNAVYGFLENGGTRCFVVNVGSEGSVTGAGRGRVGLEVLEAIDEVAIVLCPGLTDAAVHDAILTHCEKLKDRVGILDAPEDVGDIGRLTELQTASSPPAKPASGKPADTTGDSGPSGGEEANGGGYKPRPSEYGTFYFPWLTILDPIENTLVDVPPSGHVAGIWARTDAVRGVHKAPANEVVRGALNVTYRVTREEQGVLNQEGVNCIRLFGREGIRVWGARTLADAAASGATSTFDASSTWSRSRSPRARTGSSSSRTTARSGRTSGVTSARS